MTVNRRAIVSVVIGLGLALGGCSPNSPSPALVGGYGQTTDPPKPIPEVTVTVFNVAKATIAPEKFCYTFTIQLSDSGGAPSTLTKVEIEFDGMLNTASVSGDQLGQNRRLPANGSLNLELTCTPPFGYGAQNEQFAFVVAYLTDDNGSPVWAQSSVVK